MGSAKYNVFLVFFVRGFSYFNDLSSKMLSTFLISKPLMLLKFVTLDKLSKMPSKGSNLPFAQTFY